MHSWKWVDEQELQFLIESAIDRSPCVIAAPEPSNGQKMAAMLKKFKIIARAKIRNIHGALLL